MISKLLEFSDFFCDPIGQEIFDMSLIDILIKNKIIEKMGSEHGYYGILIEITNSHLSYLKFDPKIENDHLRIETSYDEVYIGNILIPNRFWAMTPFREIH